jgi:hypothetical protein
MLQGETRDSGLESDPEPEADGRDGPSSLDFSSADLSCQASSAPDPADEAAGASSPELSFYNTLQQSSSAVSSASLAARGPFLGPNPSHPGVNKCITPHGAKKTDPASKAVIPGVGPAPENRVCPALPH